MRRRNAMSMYTPFTVIKGVMEDLKSKRSIRVDGDGKIIKSPVTKSLVHKIYIVKGGTVSSIVDLGDHYRYLLITIPTIDTATLKLQVSLTHGGTYGNLSTATTASGAGLFNTTFNIYGWRYLRIVASAAQTTAALEFDVQGVTF